MPGPSLPVGRLSSFAWWSTPLRARAYVAAVIAAAIALTAWYMPTSVNWSMAGTFLVIVACAAANVELGRWAEGRMVGRDRLHKGLSAWPFAAAMLLPFAACGVVAVIAYAHTRARGMRVQMWKWNISCAVVTLAAIAAGSVTDAVVADTPAGIGSAAGFGALVAAIVAFLAIEAAGFMLISLLNDAEDERQMRAHLLSRDFYAKELTVLTTAAASVLLFQQWPGFVLFAVPAYVWMQQAVLHRMLREDADRDTKTSLLNYGAWYEVVATAMDTVRGRRIRTHGTASVMLIDLDHFKSINDTFGHLVGDQIIVAASRAIASSVRSTDLTARFGGDEFCVYMPDVDVATARTLADRVHAAVSSIEVPAFPAHVTASIGVATVPLDEHITLDELVRRADTRLYEAKLAGRDCVAV